MKILAIEAEVPGVPAEAFLPYLKNEALEVYKLRMEDNLREIYFTPESEAILLLECRNREEARDLVARLPLVKAGLIDFRLHELQPYTGFERLFEKMENA